MCGILVDVAGEQVVRVRGDENHPLSHGFTCAKGRGQRANVNQLTGNNDIGRLTGMALYSGVPVRLTPA